MHIMNKEKYNPLQLREIFHLEFLRWLGKKVSPSHYALKGGVNLRFFYNSFRYSEDMDLNERLIRVDVLQDKVMQILKSASFQNNLQPFGIDKIIPPDIAKAKQTKTTQRFYDIVSMVSQKIDALIARKIIQPRDVFDLYILSAQIEPADKEKIKLSLEKINKSRENIFEISFEEFRDIVISYLSEDDQKIYNSPQSWDEIKLKAVNFIEEFKK